ncbi:hypothetical protein A3A76_01395 [Candidatus Woesebacteria bacterium RIFCSPLOWO2_01_FULL_39_23]|uniref:Uncharacterized protein n=1 Tax=Candidatus Woesebacteria bacterium RIFCSPHIGHO2_01_FULL_40_22 TaxID=1802499 RepID=A0A1F7YHX6_9BACT|nr:MAG: hypothetical protein A2141_04975 [Candidatus Woesebacteria bacterium RBG_16_40_11]OGM26479.1 MAG: hypothetical protein A2628_02990 [Candidatus Woesebacteria bacterium RIFCSPHIGHO2_01_FULL_40_22]OGM37648.1 MAG: hypothetical protein A3E41_05510 [Candidatus Woesebacteria bacterium RIFCSPHIGHO2_12_FULL_38_9]OGM62932.1 MAG: hypothetical protein A3A76_01395 [Candidatus Woesebacteria bacterium RIFCSPLOWO2_01_FULL_39_23]
MAFNILKKKQNSQKATEGSRSVIILRDEYGTIISKRELKPGDLIDGELVAKGLQQGISVIIKERGK